MWVRPIVGTAQRGYSSTWVRTDTKHTSPENEPHETVLTVIGNSDPVLNQAQWGPNQFIVLYLEAL